MKSAEWSIMLPAAVECLALVAILSYLGLHVIKRKVIFVDLALAQIAALGTTIGFLFGIDPTSRAAFVFSLAFTMLGAAIFALTRRRGEKVPQEAIIGLVYAVTAAGAILMVDKSPHGAEHIKDLLTGTILWIKWPEIAASAAAFAVAGIFHYVFRERFVQITESPDAAFDAGVWVRLWDFLFYLSFGLVITFAVRSAGVLLVFVFLVAPAIAAVMLTASWRGQLVVGWLLGSAVTLAALAVSFWGDLPSGPTVVTSFGVVLPIVALAVYLLRAPDRRRASRRVMVGFVGAVAVALSLWGAGTMLGESGHAHDHDQDPDHHHPHPHPDPKDQHGHTVAPPPAAKASKGATAATARHADPQAWIARLAKANHSPAWRRTLVETILDPKFPLLFKDEALALLRKHASTDFGYGKRADAAAKMRAWAHTGRAPMSRPTSAPTSGPTSAPASAREAPK